jgi:hypothetical protein
MQWLPHTLPSQASKIAVCMSFQFQYNISDREQLRPLAFDVFTVTENT